MWCQLPCVFLLIGTFTFPLVIGFTDVCAGYPDMAMTLVFPPDTAQEDTMCATMLNGHGDDSNCRVNLTDATNSSEATFLDIDIKGAMSCAMVNTGANPIGDAMTTLSDEFDTIPVSICKISSTTILAVLVRICLITSMTPYAPICLMPLTEREWPSNN